MFPGVALEVGEATGAPLEAGVQAEVGTGAAELRVEEGRQTEDRLVALATTETRSAFATS